MKLSTDTINILKNLATINANLVVKQGNELASIADNNSILASAVVKETFTKEFGIYNLSEFLSLISLIPNAEFDFEDKYVKVKAKGVQVKYFYSNTEILTSPKKKISMPSTDVTFNLNKEQFGNIKNAAGALKHEVLTLKGDDGVITAIVRDPADSTANTYSIVIDEDNSCKESFTFDIKIVNLKLI